MTTSLLIAGFGGQGVMLMGKMLGECAFEQGLNVTFLPSYGPEQRGGTANCTVIISDDEIGSPVSAQLDVLCAMNQASLNQFAPAVKKGGIVLINSTLVNAESIGRDDVKVIAVDADNLAYSIGSPKVANIIMLAAYTQASGAMPVNTVLEIVMKKLAKKPELLEMNKLAFQKGVEAAQG